LSLPVLLAFVSAGWQASARAQTVISAVAGLVHYTEGGVYVDETPLLYDPTHFVHLKAGQRLRTGRGRVELMLVPDVLLRLDSGAEVEMVAARLTGAHVRLVSGSCTVEVRRVFQSGAAEVHLAGAVVGFERNGLYRFKNGFDDSAVIEVFRGKASVSTGQARYVLKPNRSMLLAKGSEGPRVEKLERLDFAMLDEWTRVGDTGRRLSTLGQGDQAIAAVLPTRLPCHVNRNCRVTGLDCVLPKLASRRIFAASGPRISRAQAR
jgi:hypothetical protein